MIKIDLPSLKHIRDLLAMIIFMGSNLVMDMTKQPIEYATDWGSIPNGGNGYRRLSICYDELLPDDFNAEMVKILLPSGNFVLRDILNSEKRLGRDGVSRLAESTSSFKMIKNLFILHKPDDSRTTVSLEGIEDLIHLERLVLHRVCVNNLNGIEFCERLARLDLSLDSQIISLALLSDLKLETFLIFGEGDVAFKDFECVQADSLHISSLNFSESLLHELRSCRMFRCRSVRFSCYDHMRKNPDMDLDALLSSFLDDLVMEVMETMLERMKLFDAGAELMLTFGTFRADMSLEEAVRMVRGFRQNSLCENKD